MQEIMLLNLPLFDSMFCRSHDTKLRNVVANISNEIAIYKNLIRIINKDIINKTDWGSVNRFWFINRRNMITTLWGKQEFMTIMTSFDSLQT